MSAAQEANRLEAQAAMDSAKAKIDQAAQEARARANGLDPATLALIEANEAARDAKEEAVHTLTVFNAVDVPVAVQRAVVRLLDPYHYDVYERACDAEGYVLDGLSVGRVK
jgi:hypothetical protein